ncbi:hypothetical protein JCM15519_04400 [Fundidesulfovibrio butyratiphilus]
MNLLQVGIVLTAIDKMSGVLGGAISKTTQGFDKLQHKISEVSAKMTEMGTKASLMGHAVLSALKTPVSAFADLDEASTNLRVAMMDNLGRIPPQFEEINRQAVELGNVLPGTTADFVNSARALIENGTALETVVGGGLKAASYLGVILKLPQAGAAEMVAKFREAFGLAESELTKMADLTQRAKFAFGLNPDEIKYAAQYAGATLNNLKLTGIENTKMFLAMQGMARQKGMEGSVFGTNFSSMLNNIGQMEQKLGRNSKIMREVNADLEQAGIHMRFFDQAGKFVGLEKMVGELEKLKVLSEHEKLNVMNKIFGMEGGRVASILSEGGVAGLKEYMGRMDRQADLMQRIDAVNKSAKNTWEALTGTIENFWAAMGGPMVTSLYPYIKAVNDFVGGPMMEWASQNQELVKWLGLGALAVGGLLVVLGGLGIVAGAVASGFAVLAGAVAAVFSPVTLVVAAVAAGALLIYKYWEPIQAFFSGFWQGFTEGLAPLRPAFDWLGGVFDKVVQKAKAFWDWLSPAKHTAGQLHGIQTFGQNFGKALGDAFARVQALGGQAFAKLGEWFKPLEPIFQRAKTLFLDIAAGVGKFAGVLKDFAVGFAGGFWDGLKSGFAGLEPVISSVSSHVVPALQAVGAAAKAFLDFGLSTGEKVWSLIKSILGGFDAGQAKTESFGKAVGKFTASVVMGVVQIGAKIASLIINLAADMVTAGAKIMTSLWEGMKKVSGGILNWVGQFAGKVMDHFPRSPAKTGPFREIPNIHIIESIAATMRPDPLVRAASAAAAAGLLALAPLQHADALAVPSPVPAAATVAAKATERMSDPKWQDPRLQAILRKHSGVAAATSSSIPAASKAVRQAADAVRPAVAAKAAERMADPKWQDPRLQAILRKHAGVAAAASRPIPAAPSMPRPLTAGQAAKPPRPLASGRAGKVGASGGAAGAGVTIHYAPTVHVQGGGNKDDIMAALKAHEHELVALIERVMARNARRQY